MDAGVFNLTPSGDSEFSGAGSFGVPRKKLPPNVVPGGAPTPIAAPVIRADPDAIAGSSLIVDQLAMWTNSPKTKTWQWAKDNVAQGAILTVAPERLDNITPGSWKLVEYAENDVNAGNPNYSNSNTVAIVAADTVPDAFSFNDVSGAELSTQYVSNAIVVSGLNRPTYARVNVAEFQVNDGPWVFSGTDQTVRNGDTVRLRRSSSGNYSTSIDMIVNIGGVTDTWTIATRSAPVVTKPVGYDDFNRPDNTNISADGSGKWTNVSGLASGFRVTNQMGATAANEGGNRFELNLTANHYAQAIMKSTTSVGPFLCVRFTDQNNLVGVRWNSGAVQLWKRVNGTLNQIGGLSLSTLDKLLRVEINNDLVRVLVDGAEIVSPVSVADVTPSMFAGVTSRTLAANPWIENWEAGGL